MDKIKTPEAGPSTGLQSLRLDKDIIFQCKRKARREGIIAGITSGFLGAVLGKRALGFDKNKTLLSGILTGVLSSYYFTQAFLGTQIAEAVNRENVNLQRRHESSEMMPDEALKDPAAEQNFA